MSSAATDNYCHFAKIRGDVNCHRTFTSENERLASGTIIDRYLQVTRIVTRRETAA